MRLLVVLSKKKEYNRDMRGRDIMKKIITFLLMMSFVLAGCSSKETKVLKVMVPSGAPALSMIGVCEEELKNGEVKVVEGSELLSSELVKKESEFDVIVAPINLGCQLIAKEQTDYRLAGVLTWGNLYIVENTSVQNNELAAFGEMAVPGKIFNLVKDANNTIKDSKVTYFNAVSDVQAQVLAGKCQYALMAEPAATATIAKAKQNGSTLKVIASLQEMYQTKVGTTEYGYPQAAIFVKNLEDTQDFLSKLDSFTNGETIKDTKQIETAVESIGADQLGVPNAKIASQTWANQNIHYKDAQDVKTDIQLLLKNFNIQYNEDMLVK